MCSAKLFLAMIFNEIKCHVNTSLGLMGGMHPPCVRACLPATHFASRNQITALRILNVILRAKDILTAINCRVAESEVFGWSRIPNTRSRSVIFCPTPDVQLDHFLNQTPKLGIPVQMAQFLLKLLLKQISCCAPRFPLILTAKLHSLYVKESEILERSDILPPTPQR